MTPTPERGERRVELSVRETLPNPSTDRRDAVVDELASLVTQGYVDHFETTAYAKTVPVELVKRGQERTQFQEYTKWASEYGVRLSPFFGTRECYSMTTGQRATRLVRPVFCLAVYRNDTLTAVYPHADEDGTYSIEDGLNALRDTNYASEKAAESMPPTTAD